MWETMIHHRLEYSLLWRAFATIIDALDVPRAAVVHHVLSNYLATCRQATGLRQPHTCTFEGGPPAWRKFVCFEQQLEVPRCNNCGSYWCQCDTGLCEAAEIQELLVVTGWAQEVYNTTSVFLRGPVFLEVLIDDSSHRISLCCTLLIPNTARGKVLRYDIYVSNLSCPNVQRVRCVMFHRRFQRST